jgi:hypothetical protein
MCGAEFTTIAHASIACASCANALSQMVRAANVTERRRRTCEKCTKPFVAGHPSGKALRGEVNEGRFCSRRCALRWRNHRPQTGQGNLFCEAAP